MAIPVIKNTFGGGEISPSCWGRTDLAKYHAGASTMRNCYTNFRGGAMSRAGTAFVGQCKQPGSAAPPRDIKFQFNINQGYALEFGDNYMRVKSNGAYVIEPAVTVTAATQANPCQITASTLALQNGNLANGDWVFFAGVGGMTQLNDQTYIAQNVNVGARTFTLTDLFGNPVDSTAFGAFTSGGTVARIFTMVTPYAAVDLPWLKYTQSADVMTLCCVNQNTATEYPPYDLSRITASDWTLVETTFASTIAAPASCTGTTQNAGTWTFEYVVTAVDKATGDESVASPIATIVSAINPAISANTITVTWAPVSGAESYNVYRADPALSSIPVGALFGFVGTALGAQFQDSNITADFTKVPPTHQNPFARGTVASTPVVSPGSGITGISAVTMTSATGSGFVAEAVVVGGQLQALVVLDGGQNYMLGDTLTVTGTWSSPPSLSYVLGPQTGTYPGGAAYFQQRRYYFNTLNAPDTYFASQPGSFTNMDSSIPVTDADAIIGTPWAQQINGIQAMVTEQSGLVILTGSGAWQLTGGAQSTAVTPSDQDATAQAYNGISATVPPIPINYDILYVQSKGSIVRDLAYNFFVNIYTGSDKTELSNHLFTNYQVLQWAWAEEPYKLVWAIRDDGIMLCLTYLKEEDVYAWTRHDTNGLYVSVQTVTEPPVDAVYLITKRYIQKVNNGVGAWVYYSERMNNRVWQYAQDAWCVDCGLSYPVNTPNATLTPASATGGGNITGYNLVVGGAGFVAPVALAVDPTGLGSGASFSVTAVGGVITGLTILTSGQNYSPGSQIVVQDANGPGGGCIVYPNVTNIVAFVASASVFQNVAGLGAPGDVIRVGGGFATVTSFVSGTEVLANITVPITAVIQNDPNLMPVPQAGGSWSIINPVSSVGGLGHLEGMTVSILADGGVVNQQVVQNGTIALPAPASSIVVGLPYTVQLQTLYMDVQGASPTVQGRRKQIPALTIRAVATRGLQIGVNQPDASSTQGLINVPWTRMIPIAQMSPNILPGQPIPLSTGDFYEHPGSDWDKKGQIAIQVTDPVPFEVTALIPEIAIGDSPGA